MSNFALPTNGRYAAVGANTGSSNATVVNPSGTPFVKPGSWTEITASWPFDSEAFVLLGSSASAGTSAISLDLARGASGSEVAFVTDFFTPETTSCLCVTLPIRIRAGERISAKISTGDGFSPLNVALYPIGPTTRRVYGFGAGGNRWQGNLNTGTLRGTQIDPGSTANTKPTSWTTLIASTNAFTTALLVSTRGYQTINAQTNCLIDIGIGSAGSEVPLIPNIYQFNQPNSSNWNKGYMVFPVSLPQGTRISARAQADSTDSSDRLCEVFLYALG